MRIGIDYRFAAKTVRGIGVYVREIVRELMALDTENEYILYTDSPLELPVPPNFRICETRPRHIIVFEQFYLPHRAVKDRLDILWYPVNSGPLVLSRRVRLAVTVHDLIAMMDFNAVKGFSVRGWMYRMGEYYRNYALRAGLHRVDLLLTVSQFSADAIVQAFGKHPEVLSNQLAVYTGDSGPGLLDRFGVSPKQYYYSMTGEAPHKNLSGLLGMADASDLPYPVVISGVYAPATIDALTARYGTKVLFTGYVTESEKMSLYRHAAVFIFLPEFEGFGIPLLEAMQMHVPIIASNRSSIPEVLGNGGELVEPGDWPRIAGLLRDLPERYGDAHRAAQDARLRQYSEWKVPARGLLHHFRQLNVIHPH